MLGRRPLAQHRDQRGDEHDQEHRAGGAEVQHEDRQQRQQGGHGVEQQLARAGQRPQPRADQDVAGLAQVAREEDDDPELGELGRLELDRAELDREERAVHLGADARQAGHHEQGDAGRRDHVAVALQHVVVAHHHDRAAEEEQPDHEPLRLLARQLGVDAVDEHQTDGGQQGGQREHVRVGLGQPGADEQVRQHAQPEEDGAVGERGVAHVLGAGGEHGGEAGCHEKRHRDESEELARSRRHQPESCPRSRARIRSTASSRLRHSWSSTRSRRRSGIARAGTPLGYSSSYRSTPKGSSYGMPR